MPEFLGPNYLDIEAHVRPAVREELIALFGDKPNPDRISLHPRAIFTGAIGIGKTTVASIVLPYMVHWVLCLRDPQGFFGLMPGSRIAFMQMSTSAKQAEEVVFGDIFARIENSPWFRTKYPYDSRYTKQIRFHQKDIWILPGDSAETTFEGYNILGGILDEIDSHKKTKVKDYAEVGYTTIHGRITSRFHDRGFLLLIGQMKSATGFAAKMYRSMKADPKAHTCRLKIWESFGWDKYLKRDGTRDSFWYDSTRYSLTTQGAAELLGYPEHIIEIPNAYRYDFMNSPVKALRDLCGLPPAVSAPFFHDTTKVLTAREAWVRRYGSALPVNERAVIADWFKAPDSLKRVIHVDIAYSGEGDALGIAMGHVPEIVTIDGEDKPYIVFDMLLRLKAAPGHEIQLYQVREIIYELREERGFRIVRVTTDGFESTDFRQQLERRRISTDKVSVDKDMLPYQDLYDAVMQGRIALPPYLTFLNTSDTEPSDVLLTELSQLTEMENGKIDHPPEGSKDLADAVAGVVFSLMGTRSYQNRTRFIDSEPGSASGREPTIPTVGSGSWFQHPAITTMTPSAPVPPALGEPTPWTPPRR